MHRDGVDLRGCAVFAAGVRSATGCLFIDTSTSKSLRETFIECSALDE